MKNPAHDTDAAPPALRPTTDSSRDRNPALVYLARLSPGSRRMMKHALEAIAPLLGGEGIPASRFPWGEIQHQHTATIRARLAEQYAPSTVNRMLAALRGVLREAWQLGLMSDEDYHRARDVRGLASGKKPAGRALTTGEIRRIFAACEEDDSPAGARDAAILALLYGGGLKRAEVAALNLSDFDRATGNLRIRRGPERRPRHFQTRDGSRRAIEAWLEFREARRGSLFCPVNKGGKIAWKRLTSQAVYLICQKRTLQAGVRRSSPNDFRRTYIGHLLDGGADLVTVQHMAGHADIRSTARYEGKNRKPRRRAAPLLVVPYGLPTSP